MKNTSNIKSPHNDLYYMSIALTEAKLALKEGNLPVGAVIIHNNKLIATGHARARTRKSNLAHAEINTIANAEQFLYDHKTECDLFTTLEPCLMCFGAILNFRFRRLIISARDHSYGFLTIFDSLKLTEYSHRFPEITTGLLTNKSLSLLKRDVTKHRDGLHLVNEFGTPKRS